jgi:hypothetical protein
MIVIGELLLVVCSLCYLLWWTITFRPSVRTPSGGGLFLAGAVLGGLGGLVLLTVGIAALLPKASPPALVATIVGGVSVGALLLYVTSGVAHRPVTTELPLIVVWATVQLAAGITLRTAGVRGRRRRPPGSSRQRSRRWSGWPATSCSIGSIRSLRSGSAWCPSPSTGSWQQPWRRS